MIINKLYEHQNLLSLWLVSFLVGQRTYQHPCNVFTQSSYSVNPKDIRLDFDGNTSFPLTNINLLVTR